MKRVVTAILAVTSVLMTDAKHLQAQVTVGHDSGIGNCYPFGCSFGITRYQQIYDADAFANPISIETLTFYHTHSAGDFGPGVYDIYFSTTSNGLEELATVPGVGDVAQGDLDSNVTASETLFGHFTLGGGSRNGHPYITFAGTTPFLYDPSLGNLLFDVVIRSTGSSNTPLFLDTDLSGIFTTRAWEYEPDGIFLGGSSDAAGLVTTFNAVSSVPEPLSIGMLGGGLLLMTPAFRRYSGKFRLSIQRYDAE